MLINVVQIPAQRAVIFGAFKQKLICEVMYVSENKQF